MNRPLEGSILQSITIWEKKVVICFCESDKLINVIWSNFWQEWSEIYADGSKGVCSAGREICRRVLWMKRKFEASRKQLYTTQQALHDITNEKVIVQKQQDIAEKRLSSLKN